MQGLVDDLEVATTRLRNEYSGETEEWQAPADSLPGKTPLKTETGELARPIYRRALSAAG